jgi:hypothetical protein
MEVKTQISYGYKPLLQTFFKANDLTVACVERFEERIVSSGTSTNVVTKEVNPLSGIVTNARCYTTLIFQDGSETSEKITFMSYIHAGFENMLCDYLIRCGIMPNQISSGRYTEKRDLEELDRQWEEHRKHIGLSR